MRGLKKVTLLKATRRSMDATGRVSTAGRLSWPQGTRALQFTCTFTFTLSAVPCCCFFCFLKRVHLNALCIFIPQPLAGVMDGSFTIVSHFLLIKLRRHFPGDPIFVFFFFFSVRVCFFPSPYQPASPLHPEPVSSFDKCAVMEALS